MRWGHVIVCGGRNYGLDPAEVNFLNHKLTEIDPMTLITGGARGADTLAEQWARNRAEVHLVVMRADWNRYGNSAGPVRNKKMLDHLLTYEGSKAVVAFPGGKGTSHMVNIARKAGVTVVQFHIGEQKNA